MYILKNRSAVWTRGIAGGLGVLAMAAALSVTGPQEAKAASNCSSAVNILAPAGVNGVNDGSPGLLCLGNIYAGFLNGSYNGNTATGLGSLQIGNIAAGAFNQSFDGNSSGGPGSLQIGNVALGTRQPKRRRQ